MLAWPFLPTVKVLWSFQLILKPHKPLILPLKWRFEEKKITEATITAPFPPNEHTQTHTQIHIYKHTESVNGYDKVEHI